MNVHRSSWLVKALLCASLLGRPELSLAAVEAGAQSPEGASFTVDQIKGFYSEVFLPSRTKRGSVSVDLAALPADHVLAPLVTENEHLLRYLLTSHGIPDEELRAAAASPSFPNSYFELLKRDLDFGIAFLEVVHRFLGERTGGGIQDYRAAPIRQVPQRTLLNTAVRFVYPDAIVDGRIQAHICSAINGLADGTVERDVFVESLVYSTILREAHVAGSPLMERIFHAVELAESLDLSVDEAVAVSRAQGVVWVHLRESPELREYLRREFKRIGPLLPIEVLFQE